MFLSAIFHQNCQAVLAVVSINGLNCGWLLLGKRGIAKTGQIGSRDAGSGSEPDDFCHIIKMPDGQTEIVSLPHYSI